MKPHHLLDYCGYVKFIAADLLPSHPGCDVDKKAFIAWLESDVRDLVTLAAKENAGSHGDLQLWQQLPDLVSGEYNKDSVRMHNNKPYKILQSVALKDDPLKVFLPLIDPESFPPCATATTTT